MPLFGHQECKGQCFAKVAGEGLVANCSRSAHPFQLSSQLTEGTNSTPSSTDIFGTYLLPNRKNGLTIMSSSQPLQLGIQIKTTTDCGGRLIIRNCSVRPAVVLYPVVIDCATNTISLDPHTSIANDTVLDYSSIPDNYDAHDLADRLDSPLPGTLGGYVEALMEKFQSVAHIRFDHNETEEVHADYYGVNSEYNISHPYFEMTSSGSSFYNNYLDMTQQENGILSCSVNFRDPTYDILTGMRELMFRMATTAANLTQWNADFHVVDAESVFPSLLHASLALMRFF